MAERTWNMNNMHGYECDVVTIYTKDLWRNAHDSSLSRLSSHDADATCQNVANTRHATHTFTVEPRIHVGTE